MPLDDQLLPLERRAWQALSSGGDAAAAFYSEVLADDVLMLLPGGLVIDDRSAVLDSMRGQPWSSFSLSEERVVRLGDTSAVVAYRADARRGDAGYSAWLSSTYVLVDGSWRLTVHQQTPI